jgi:hypothetical protein
MMTLQTLHKIIFKEPMPGRKCQTYSISNNYWHQVFPIKTDCSDAVSHTGDMQP